MLKYFLSTPAKGENTTTTDGVGAHANENTVDRTEHDGTAESGASTTSTTQPSCDVAAHSGTHVAVNDGEVAAAVRTEADTTDRDPIDANSVAADADDSFIQVSAAMAEIGGTQGVTDGATSPTDAAAVSGEGVEEEADEVESCTKTDTATTGNNNNNNINSSPQPDDWQEVTMSAFTHQQDAHPSSAVGGTHETREEAPYELTAATAGEDITSPTTTVLNERAREQRAREDAARQLLVRRTEEELNLRAVQQLSREDAAVRAERQKTADQLALEAARAVAAALDRAEEEEREEKTRKLLEQLRRERDLHEAQTTNRGNTSNNNANSNPPQAIRTATGAASPNASASASPSRTDAAPNHSPLAGPPTTPSASASPSRKCDCLGASSGFHRQGCPLRTNP